jgi:hypothetical protein
MSTPPESDFVKWCHENDPGPPKDNGCFVVIAVGFLLLVAAAVRLIYLRYL